MSVYGTDAVFVNQGMTEEVWREAVHAAAAIPDQGSLLALWQQLTVSQHDWNAPSGAAQVMSALVLATSRPDQGPLCTASSQPTVGGHLHTPNLYADLLLAAQIGASVCYPLRPC